MIGVLGFFFDKYIFFVFFMFIKKFCIMIQGNVVYSLGCKVGVFQININMCYVYVYLDFFDYYLMIFQVNLCNLKVICMCIRVYLFFFFNKDRFIANIISFCFIVFM